MRTIQIDGETHQTAREAIESLKYSDRECAIAIGGKFITTEYAEAERIEELGVAFTYLSVSSGLLMTVPVN